MPSRAGSSAADRSARSSMRDESAEHTLVRIEMPRTGRSRRRRRFGLPPIRTSRRRSAPRSNPGSGGRRDERRSPLRIWILPRVVLAARPPSRRGRPTRSIRFRTRRHLCGSGSVVFVLAGLLLVPLELLAIAAGVCFGAPRGGVVALVGSLAAAVIGYVAGRAIGATGLARWMSRRSYRSVRQLGARGVVGVVVLRLAERGERRSDSSALRCGPRSVRDLPGGHRDRARAGDRRAQRAGRPASPHAPAIHRCRTDSPTIGAAVLLFALASGLRAFLLIRQFAPSVSSHRDRAEFG